MVPITFYNIQLHMAVIPLAHEALCVLAPISFFDLNFYHFLLHYAPDPWLSLFSDMQSLYASSFHLNTLTLDFCKLWFLIRPFLIPNFTNYVFSCSCS